MRDFLTDKHIPGAMMVSRSEDLLLITVPSLLQWTDWVLLLRDNINPATEKVVQELKAKYGDRIRISDSGIPVATEAQETRQNGLLSRFKVQQGPIRQKVIDFMRDVHENEKPIDCFVWPDSDEIFSKNFPSLLKRFMADPELKGITLKPIDVYGDMTTILGTSMTGHTRVLKIFDGLSAIPHRAACYYNGLTKKNRFGNVYTLIHLAGLTPKKRGWRDKHWKPNSRPQSPVWRLKKPVNEHLPEEIYAELRREPDMTAGEYIEGGDKRMPMGVENASSALREASDLLDTMGIRHYLAFGTALGIHRDKSIMKYDWDVDIICDAEDLKKFDSNLVRSSGFDTIKIKKDIPRWISKEGKSEETFVRTVSFMKYGVRIDLDPAYMSKDGTSRIILKGRKRYQFAGKHPKEWFDNATQVEYRGKQYLLPNPIGDYLKSNYGETWNKPVYGPTNWSVRPCLAREFECADCDFGNL